MKTKSQCLFELIYDYRREKKNNPDKKSQHYYEIIAEFDSVSDNSQLSYMAQAKIKESNRVPCVVSIKLDEVPYRDKKLIAVSISDLSLLQDLCLERIQKSY